MKMHRLYLIFVFLNAVISMAPKVRNLSPFIVDKMFPVLSAEHVLPRFFIPVLTQAQAHTA